MKYRIDYYKTECIDVDNIHNLWERPDYFSSYISQGLETR